MTCLLSFPAAPHRAWRISESDQFPDEYVGHLVPADGWTGPTRTASGPLGLVVEALIQDDVRHGLPVLIPPEGRGFAAKATRRIAQKARSAWRPAVRTDRDMYADALTAQKLANPSRWAPSDPWGGDAA